MVQPTMLEFVMFRTAARTLTVNLALVSLLAAAVVILLARSAGAQTGPGFTQPGHQTAVQVDQPVTFAGTGCPPGEPVTVGERTTTAADDGSFAVTLVFPPGTFDAEVPAEGIEDVREFVVNGACGGETFTAGTLVPARAIATAEQIPTRIDAGGGGALERRSDLTGIAVAIGVSGAALVLAVARRRSGDATPSA
jgi:hypothetical protein